MLKLYGTKLKKHTPLLTKASLVLEQGCISVLDKVQRYSFCRNFKLFIKVLKLVYRKEGD